MAADGGDRPIYFAQQEAQKLVGECDTRERNWWTAVTSRGLQTLWRLEYAQAFGMDANTRANATQQLQYVGAQASFVRFRMNLTRPYVKQKITLAIGQRPAFQPLAVNDDAESMAQVPIAAKVIDYLFRAANGEAAFFEALESDAWFGEGSVWTRWDGEAGERVEVVQDEPATDQFTGEPLLEPDGSPVLVPQKRMKRSGRPKMTALYPWDLVRDTTLPESPWVIVKEKASKHELAALYPEKAKEILAQRIERNWPGVVELFLWDWASLTDDQIVVKHFYHRPCAAVPGGRYVGYVGDVVLWDVPCPLEEGIPVVTIRTAKYYGTAFGYAESADLLAIQEMLDELTSQSATNVIKFGNQSLWAEDGVEWDQETVARGGGFFTLKQGQKPPAAIQWAQLPEAVKFLLQFLPEQMGVVSGMNDVAMGRPESNIQSGTFAALMLNIAEKFQSSTQAEYDYGLNRQGNVMLELVRANADTKFLAEVSGEGNVPYLEYFTREDFAGVKRVIVQRQSPLMNNISGRFAVFEALNPLPKDQRQAAVQLLTTGDSSAFCENDLSCIILIRKENERLSRGEPTPVSKSDDIKLHNPKHQASLDRLRSQDPPKDLQVRRLWEAAIQAHIDHIGEHAVVWAQTDPIYAMGLGLPMPPQPPTMPGDIPKIGANAAPPGAKPGAPGGGAPGKMMNGGGGRMPALPEPAQPPANANMRSEGP